MKSVQIKMNIASDTANLSMMQVVFDSLKPTEVFNGIKQVEHDLKKAFEQAGIITKHGVGVGEMSAYVEYMSDVILEAEHVIYSLYHTLTEVEDSDLECKSILGEMIKERIEETEGMVDKYYDMFEEVKTVEATEWDMNRPQTVVETVEDAKED